MVEGVPKDTSRRMLYPYTFTAKIAQFPFKHYYNNSWVYRYYMYALIPTFYVFYKIEQLSYSPANVKKWNEILRKTYSGEDAHH